MQPQVIPYPRKRFVLCFFVVFIYIIVTYIHKAIVLYYHKSHTKTHKKEAHTI